jgi:GH24 family phage-related lysozyme (muramidase)
VVRKGEVWDKPCIGELARRTLEKDLAAYQAAVNRAVNVPLWPLQFDSLTSFRFNMGGGAKGVKDAVRVNVVAALLS